ncbi:MAG: pilus assembly protein TadG-related protein [Xanthobacteraceae bacterium]
MTSTIIGRINRLAARIRSFGTATDGNVAIIFAIALLPVVGALGIGIDYARGNRVRSELQTALDAAVLAAAKQPAGQQATTADNVFSANFTDQSITPTPSPTFVVNADGSVTGTARTTVPTSFLQILQLPPILPGPQKMQVSASATAVSAPAGTPANVCILLVDPSAAQSLTVNANAKINAPTCEIDVVSTASPAAAFNSPNTLSVANICVKGSTDILNGSSRPPVQLKCPTITDPFAGKLPTVSVGGCTFNNKTYSSSTVTVNPGVYCGYTNFNGSPTITFNPGLYIIKGGSMNINAGSKITGTGVTFYLVDETASIQFNGGITATLSAPTSGTYAGLLIFEPSGLPLSKFVFDDTVGENLQGLLYMPSRNVTFNAVSNVTAENITMVFDTLIVNAASWGFQTGSLGMTNPNSGPQTLKLTN